MRLASLRLGGRERLLPTVDAIVGGLYPMAPWAGRIRRGRFRFDGREHQLAPNLGPHALHGSLLERSWSREGEDWVAPLQPGWPFRGQARHRLRVDEAGAELVLAVEAEERMPVSLGWHPWFAGARVELRAAAMYRRDGEGICDGGLVPVPPGPWDDCFPGASAEVVWPDLRLRVESDCACLTVYDQDPRAVCVEPQSAPPDAVNLGLATVLGKGERLERRMWLRVVADPDR